LVISYKIQEDEMTKHYIGDTHFSHENIVKWEGEGEPSRPWDNIEDMNEAMRDNWNSVVDPKDTIYHLGDVAFGVTARESLRNLEGLNGKKILICGNHDVVHSNVEKGSVKDLTQYFDKIYGCKEISLGGVRGIMSHIPVHDSQLDERFQFNVHGHLHHLLIDDPRYINVSVEQINYTPVSNEYILDRLRDAGII
jgi:calcineurin-like phosphoesterase family protein